MKKQIKPLLSLTCLALAGSMFAGSVTNLKATEVKAAETYSAFMLDGSYSADVWASIEGYELSSNTADLSGTIKFAVFGTEFYMQVKVNDATATCNDNPYTKISAGDDFFELDGKYFDTDAEFTSNNPRADRGWPRKISGSTAWDNPRVCLGISYADGAYTLTEKYSIGDYAVKGGTIAIDFKHYDAGAAGGWGITQTNYASFTHNLVLVEPYVLELSKDSYSESVWETAQTYAMVSNSADLSGKIQFAVFGQDLYTKVAIKDPTGTCNDNPYTKISAGDDFFELDGKYFDTDAEFTSNNPRADRGWPRKISGSTAWDNPRVCLGISYADGTYTMIEKYSIGDYAVNGGEVTFQYIHYDAGAEGGWGITQPNNVSFNHKLSFVGNEPIVKNYNYIIPEVAGQFNAATSFASSEEYDLETVSGTCEPATVQFALHGTKLYFKLVAKDSTKDNCDTPIYSITHNGKTVSMLTGRYLENCDESEAPSWSRMEKQEFGDFIYSSVKYIDGSYVYISGYELGSLGLGAGSIDVNFSSLDGTAWSQNVSDYANVCTFAHTLSYAQVDSTIVQKVEGNGGLVTNSEWALTKAYPFAGDVNGSVKLAVCGTSLFMRLEAEDTTKITGKDFIGYSVTANGKCESKQGNFDPWLTNWGNLPEGAVATDFGVTLQSFSYDEEAHKYIFLRGFELGKDYLEGGAVKVSGKFMDAGASGEWGTGATGTFDINLKLVKECQTIALPTATYSVDSGESVSLVAGETAKGLIGHSYAIIASEAPTGVTRTFSEGADAAAITEGGTYTVTYSISDKSNFTWDNGTNADIVFSIKLVAETIDLPTVSYKVNGGDSMNLLSKVLLVADAEAPVEFVAPEIAGATRTFSAGADAAFSGVGTYTVTYTLNNPSAVWADETNEPKVFAVQLDDFVITDLPSMPNEAAWNEGKILEFTNMKGQGSVASVVIYTANENIFFRITVVDETFSFRAERLEMRIMGINEFGEEVSLYQARGNFDNWLADYDNTRAVTSPSLCADYNTCEDGEAGSYLFATAVHDQGFYIGDIGGTNFIKPGMKLHLILAVSDSQNSSQAWADARDAFPHYELFDQILTFGEKADTTIRPIEPTETISIAESDVFNTNVKIAWNDVDGADTYKIFIYEDAEEGAEEPYEYITAEGPIYSGDGSYNEKITGLSNGTRYTFQLMVYDIDGTLIGGSNLVHIKTMTNAEYNEYIESLTSVSEVTSTDTSVIDNPSIIDSSTSEEPSVVVNPSVEETSNAETSTEPTDPAKSGCFGSIAAVGSLISILSLVGIALTTKRRK